MEIEKITNVSRWYAVYTKPGEESRANQNLIGWGVETFSPKIRKKRLNPFTGKPLSVSASLFPRYIFARFDADKMMHKISYTRGVKSVVNFNHTPLAVEDEIIALIRAKVGEDGFVRLEEEFKRGDEVRIDDGSMCGIKGIFDSAMRDERRIRILLTAISYQASVIVEKALVQRACVTLPPYKKL
ncbi:MAG TPA: transcription termination/antitermination NusG family protein [Pyrinomonadaceae bacterium]